MGNHGLSPEAIARADRGRVSAEAAALRLELQAMRHDRDQARAEADLLADALESVLAPGAASTLAVDLPPDLRQAQADCIAAAQLLGAYRQAHPSPTGTLS